MLREMAAIGKMPLAIVFDSITPIRVQGTAFGDITMMAGVNEDILTRVPHGAESEVDPTTKLLRVWT